MNVEEWIDLHWLRGDDPETKALYTAWDEAYRAGMERAAEVCDREADYCLEHYQGTHDTKWLADATVAEKLEQAIRSEISNGTDNPIQSR